MSEQNRERAQARRAEASETRVRRLLISGIGYSGSSAIVDMLTGNRAVAVFPGEFNLFRRFGLVGDWILDPSSSLVLQAQLSPRLRGGGLRYVGSLLDNVPVVGIRKAAKNFNTQRRAHLATRLLLETPDAPQSFQERLHMGRDWLSDISGIASQRKGVVLFDQPVVPFRHDRIFPEVFAPSLHVVVIRNPADQIADLSQALVRAAGRSHYLQDQLDALTRGERERVASHLVEHVEQRYSWLRGLLSSAHPPVIFDFEDIVTRTDEVFRFLEERIGEALSPWRDGAFVPEVSQKNVGTGRLNLRGKVVHEVEQLLPVYESLLRRASSIGQAL